MQSLLVFCSLNFHPVYYILTPVMSAEHTGMAEKLEQNPVPRFIGLAEKTQLKTNNSINCGTLQ